MVGKYFGGTLPEEQAADEFTRCMAMREEELRQALTALAERNIGVFVLSTYDTDYVLTREESFERTLEALADAGYDIA